MSALRTMSADFSISNACLSPVSFNIINKYCVDTCWLEALWYHLVTSSILRRWIILSDQSLWSRSTSYVVAIRSSIPNLCRCLKCWYLQNLSIKLLVDYQFLKIKLLSAKYVFLLTFYELIWAGSFQIIVEKEVFSKFETIGLQSSHIPPLSHAKSPYD